MSTLLNKKFEDKKADIKKLQVGTLVNSKSQPSFTGGGVNGCIHKGAAKNLLKSLAIKNYYYCENKVKKFKS